MPDGQGKEKADRDQHHWAEEGCRWTSSKRLIFFPASAAFSLGLERTGGFEAVAFCEIEPFCKRVLAKHWPGVPIYDDVRELTGSRLAADGIAVDVICGGFPCQDISTAGGRAGLGGGRSGLWGEYARLIGEIRPRFAIVENVANLLCIGLGGVLGDLAEVGFDAEWHCIPASAVCAPYERERVWIVASPLCEGGANTKPRIKQGVWPSIVDAGRSRIQAPDTDGQGQHDGAVDAQVASLREDATTDV